MKSIVGETIKEITNNLDSSSITLTFESGREIILKSNFRARMIFMKELPPAQSKKENTSMKFEINTDHYKAPNRWVEKTPPLPIEELLREDPSNNITLTDKTGRSTHWRAKPRNLELYEKINQAVHSFDFKNTTTERVYNLLEEEGLV